jgi:hypothetical protein
MRSVNLYLYQTFPQKGRRAIHMALLPGILTSFHFQNVEPHS